MNRSISSLIAFLIVLGITISIAIFVSRFIIGSMSLMYENPNRLLVSSKHVSALSPQIFRLEIVFSNPTKQAFCIKLDRVDFYTYSLSSSETVSVSQYSPAIVVASGSTINYEIVFRSSTIHSSGIMVAYFNMYNCTSIQLCRCNDSATYIEAIPIMFQLIKSP
ncbi:MAG: hypothetical protein QXK24_00860 [Ignisphaera sp.]|uniref:Uncharacterized protein n=1 Tax=Ignisphaera aggregans TaxID=334771 RepID=A0A7C4D069_9CREN